MKENVIRDKSFQFALMIIELYNQMTEQKEYVLSKQLLKSGTSIGSNIEEAQAAQSKKDFLSKMSIASKEARETRYWLLLLRESKLVNIDCSNLLVEINEICKILTSIVKSASR
jgi:four helix bundle protein